MVTLGSTLLQSRVAITRVSYDFSTPNGEHITTLIPPLRAHTYRSDSERLFSRVKISANRIVRHSRAEEVPGLMGLYQVVRMEMCPGLGVVKTSSPYR